MASAGKAPQALTKLSAVARPRYVCRACKLVQREIQQTRNNSSLSSQRAIRPTTRASCGQRRSISFGSMLGRSPKPDETQENALIEGEAEAGIPMEPYVEATTWDGLESMGHKGHWKDLPVNPADNYRPWIDPFVAAPPQRNQFLPLLWASIVEYLALKELGRDPHTIHKEGPPKLGSGMSSLKIQLSSTGTISHLDNPQGGLRAECPAVRAGAKGSAIKLSIEEVEKQLEGARFDFRDPITFTILKRFSRLTKHRVPDPLLNTIMRGNKDLLTFVDLLTQTAKPKSKTFAEVLLAKQKKALDFAARARLEGTSPPVQPPAAVPSDVADPIDELVAEVFQQPQKQKKQKPTFQPLGPNVTIVPRRQTYQDREMEVGRWKVIKKELENRGLPVYAHPRHVPQGEKWLPEEKVRVLEKEESVREEHAGEGYSVIG